MSVCLVSIIGNPMWMASGAKLNLFVSFGEMLVWNNNNNLLLKNRCDLLFGQDAAGLDDGSAEHVDFNVAQFFALWLGAAEAGGCLCGVEGSVDGVVTDARAGPISPKLNKERKGYTESISKWTSQQSRLFSRCLEISPSQSFSLFLFGVFHAGPKESVQDHV